MQIQGKEDVETLLKLSKVGKDLVTGEWKEHSSGLDCSSLEEKVADSWNL